LLQAQKLDGLLKNARSQSEELYQFLLDFTAKSITVSLHLSPFSFANSFYHTETSRY
jgi:hypothetical protein